MEIKPNVFNAGINLDVIPYSQPEGTYRYALNATKLSSTGDLTALTAELGNTLKKTITYTPIGAKLLGSDEFIVFSTDNVDSEIGLYNRRSNSYTALINAQCLNFSTEHPVDAQFRLLKGCERVVYFTDEFNNYRVINIDNLQELKDESGNWDCNKLELARPVNSPKIDVQSVEDQGGNLKVGAYQFAIRYLDSYLSATPWLYLTRAVNIVDEAYSSDYYQIDGAVNVISSIDEEGSVLPTTKVINLDITNLDTSFEYYQIAVIASTSATGQTSQVYVLPERPIGDSEDVYTVTSVDPNTGAILTELGDITSIRTIPEVVKTHEQLDNTLYLANLEFKEYDFASFQKKALDIEVRWDNNNVKINQDATIPGNPKAAKTPYEMQTLVGDEIYAVAIQYQIKGYKWTPPFHIPGRVKNANDALPILYNASDNDQKPLPVKESYEKWEVYNTATLDSDSDPYLLGYYEADQNYPDTVDCAGNRVFPTGKIRHHRLPSRKDIPHTFKVGDEMFATILGLKFSNIEYPHEDITGHRFLISKRDASNSTVLDMGLLVGPRYDSIDFDLEGGKITFSRGIDGAGTQYRNLEQEVVSNSDLNGFPEPAKESYNVNFFFSPKSLINKTRFNGSHFSAVGRLKRFSQTEDRQSVSKNSGGTLEWRTKITSYFDSFLDPGFITQNYDYSTYVSPRSFQRVTGPLSTYIWNRSHSNTVNAYRFSHDFPGAKGLYIVNNKVYRKPYGNLDTIQYVPLHSYPLTLADSQRVFGGDAYISELRILDLNDEDEATRNRDIHYASKIDGLWVESQLNYELRHPGNSSDKAIYKEGQSLAEYWLTKTAYPTENSSKFEERDPIVPEYYGYNPDFSRYPEVIPAVPLQSTFDYCNDCGDIYPRRIIKSGKSLEEFNSDSYREFLPNDRVDLPGKDKAITSLVADKDQLYAITENGLYFIPTRPQSLKTTEDNVYLTTGDAFSIPPRKLSSTDYPYAGTTHKLSVIKTEFGVFFMDEKSGKFFNMSSGLQDTSSNGMHAFFEENSAIELDKQFNEVIGVNYPVRYTTSENGVGYISSYDSRFRRIILHKRDFKIIDISNFGGLYVSEQDAANKPNTLLYDLTDNVFKIFSLTNGLMTVSLEDKDYFENKSWTLSLDLDSKSWVSFHSYLPSYMFFDESTLFSSNHSNNLWEHNKGNYQTFYGTKYDHIIDFVMPSRAGAKIYSNVEYASTTTLDGVEVDDVTFDRVLFYNNQQSSGLLDLDASRPYNPSAIAKTTKADKFWNINAIRDFVIDYNQPLFTTDWTQTQDVYPIDKVPNPASTSASKSRFKISRFRDRYLGVRLYSKSDSNLKITTDLVLTSQRNSYR